MANEHFDVLIIAAGLSGIGAACHLRRECPDKTFAILERRESSGGTWDLFRYPGIRSDSDMYTLGYSFRPWTSPKIIADGPAIRQYIRDTAAEYQVDSAIRYQHHVKKVAWSSKSARWTLEAEHTETGEKIRYTAGFVIACAGYYNYDKGYTPVLPGRKNFRGTIIHPQHWPEDLDYSNKRVVIIGSGATAVTLLPAMADKAAHVTMLQRSPTYVASVPEEDIISEKLRKVLPDKLVYRLGRTRNVALQMLVYQLSQRHPAMVRKMLLKQVELQVGKNVDMRHFTPVYNPWEERLCAVPNGDLFKALRQGKASVVTDQIDTFTARGIRLKSGEQLDADIVITATGLDLKLMGGIKVQVDNRALDPTQALAYKGFMLSDLPNMAMIFGYTNSSWTLKADLSSEYICRLLKHMDNTGTRQCTPRAEPSAVSDEPFLNLRSGYIQRGAARFPRQGNRAPWKVRQNYALDLAAYRFSRVDDGVMEFSNPLPPVLNETVPTGIVKQAGARSAKAREKTVPKVAHGARSKKKEPARSATRRKSASRASTSAAG